MAPVQQAPPKQVLCEGLLGLKKKRGVEQRYFVLYDEGLLNYYLDRQGFVDGLEPRGRVNIDDVDTFKEDNGGFKLEIDGKAVEFVSVPGGDSDIRPWTSAIEKLIKVRRGDMAEDDEDAEAEEDEEEEAGGNEVRAASAGNDAQQGPLCHGLLEVSRKGKSHSRYFVLNSDRMEYFASGDDFAAGAESRGRVLTMSHVIGFKEHSGGFTVMLESEGVPQAPLDFKGSEEELAKWYPVWREQLKSSLADDYQELVSGCVPGSSATLFERFVQALGQKGRSAGAAEIQQFLDDSRLEVENVLSSFGPGGELQSGEPLPASCFNDFYKWMMLPVVLAAERASGGVRCTFGVNIRDQGYRKQLYDSAVGAASPDLFEEVKSGLRGLTKRMFDRSLFEQCARDYEIPSWGKDTVDAVCGPAGAPRALVQEFRADASCKKPVAPESPDSVLVQVFVARDEKLNQDRVYIEATGPWHRVTWLETSMMQVVYDCLFRNRKRQEYRISKSSSGSWDDSAWFADWLAEAMCRCARSVKAAQESGMKGALFTGRRTGGLALMMLQGLYAQQAFRSPDGASMLLGSSSVTSRYLSLAAGVAPENVPPCAGTHAHELQMTMAAILGDLDDQCGMPLSHVVSHMLYFYRSRPLGSVSEGAVTWEAKMSMLPDTIGTQAFMRTASKLRVPFGVHKGEPLLSIIGKARQDSGTLEAFRDMMSKFGYKGACMASEIETGADISKASSVGFEMFGAGGFMGDSEKAWDSTKTNISMAVKVLRVYVGGSGEASSFPPVKTGELGSDGRIKDEKFEIDGTLPHEKFEQTRQRVQALCEATPKVSDQELQELFEGALRKFLPDEAAQSLAGAAAEAGSAARPKSPARGISFRGPSVASVQSSRASTTQRRAAPSEQASPARPSAVSTMPPSRPSSPPSSPPSRSRTSTAPGRQSTATERAASSSASARQTRKKVQSEELAAEQKRTPGGGSIRRQASTASQVASRQSRTPRSAASSPRSPSPPRRSTKPPWCLTMGSEGVLASGLLTMQGLGVTGEEVYCVLLPDRFLWSQAQAVEPSSVSLANVRSVDVLVGGFELEFFDQGDEQWSPRGGGTSKVQLRVGSPDAAATTEAGSRPQLARMSTDELRRQREVEQELHRWEEALHKVDWTTLTQDHGRHDALLRDAAESPSPRTARSLSPRMAKSPRSRNAEVKPGMHQEQPRCQGKLGFSVHGTLQWRYAMLFGDRLDAWDSKEAALVGLGRGACPPTRITMSTLQSLEIVDQGFLLKSAGTAHGVHVGPDQIDLGRWSSALARALSESRLTAATSPAASARSAGKQRTPSSGRGATPSKRGGSPRRQMTFFSARAQMKGPIGKPPMKLVGVPASSKAANLRTTPKVNIRDTSHTSCSAQTREAFFDKQCAGKITGQQRSITPPRKEEVRWNKAVHTPVLVDRGLDGSGPTNIPAKPNEVGRSQSAVGPPVRIEGRQDPAARRQFKPNHQFP